MAGETILVVDDEKAIVRLAELYLRNEGYRVETAYDGAQAVAKVKSARPALMLLDLMMPGVDGWEVCRQLRKESDVPIIILTARTDDVDKVAGLELGADDYVTKPFNPRELIARVRAVLRRYQASVQIPPTIDIGKMHIDLGRREVLVNGSPMGFRAKEMNLLVALARRPGMVQTREALLNQVWGYDYGDSRTLSVHIAWLRDKLTGAGVEIQTVWGIGYKLVES
ncbi:MAG: response regulator transcription factor [Chloroflexi bacterium]|nr:response regulator transcription factor [Chloroflexota bacterium]